LKKTLGILIFLLPAVMASVGCGGYSPSSQTGTGIKYRALISDSVTAGTGSAGVYILNAQTDVRGTGTPLSAGKTPGMMVVSPNLTLTLIFSGDGSQFSDNQLTAINNVTEATAGSVTLPGVTESFVVSPDSSVSYVAVPTAPLIGQSPGVVDVVNLTSGVKTSEISCPPYQPNVSNPVCLPNPAVQPPPDVCIPTPYLCGGFNPPYRYISIGNTGTRILAFSTGSNSVANAVAVITPSSVGTSQPVITFVSGSGPTAFDHPVWAFFNSDDTIAYVVNCGAECGGSQASVQKLDLTTSPPTPGPTVPVDAATVALVNNSTMYLAGTPNGVSCPIQGTQTTCGELTTFDLTSMTVVGTPVAISDGYHTHLALGANGQLFIGSRTCSQAGCLSIYNTLGTAVGDVPAGGVGFPAGVGDVTGIEPIGKRSVVYVVQGGALSIYDDSTDALEYNPNNPNNPGQIYGLVGYFIDVKTIDF
jgi:hypothetical protein